MGIMLITGGESEDSGANDLFLFDSKIMQCKRYKSVIPATKRELRVVPPDELGGSCSQGLVQRNENEYILWNAFGCLLLTLEHRRPIKSIHDNVKFTFKEIDSLPFEKGVREQ